MKRHMLAAFGWMILIGMGLALWCAIASLIAGCGPVDVNVGEKPAHSADRVIVFDCYDFEAHVLTIDGVDYIVVENGGSGGIAICPKVFPTSEPKPE